jgi:hypothetical protein
MSVTDPTGYISIPPELTRGVAWKKPCRVATTASITISTALNNGDTVDGVTLATGDRVLVKDQSTGSQNGIYVVGVTPIRAFDMDQDLTTAVAAEEIAGAFVYVIAGTANAGKVFHTTNVPGGTLGSTTITWAEFTPGTTFTLTVKDEGTPLATGATSLDFVGPLVTATGATAAKTITVTGALDDLTDVTITSPAAADRLRYSGTAWVNSALIWTPLTVFDGTTWLPLVDGSGNAIMAEA